MKGMMSALALVVPVLALPVPVLADDISNALKDATAKYEANDLAASVRVLEGAIDALHQKLGQEFVAAFPDLPGWQGEGAEIKGLTQVGGGLSVRQSFVRPDEMGKTSAAWMNVALLLDSPAVTAAKTLLDNAAALGQQPQMKQIEVNGLPALLRFDPDSGNGEVIMVLNGRVLLEIEGNRLKDGQALIEAASKWKLDRIKALAGV